VEINFFNPFYGYSFLFFGCAILFSRPTWAGPRN